MQYVRVILLSAALLLPFAGCVVRPYEPAPGPAYGHRHYPQRRCFNECAAWGYRQACPGCRPYRTCLRYHSVCR